jgi:hypothetical protein
MRFFMEFTLSQWQRFFTSFRMTGMAFPSLRHTLLGERGWVRGTEITQIKREEFLSSLFTFFSSSKGIRSVSLMNQTYLLRLR